jgi:hypothetical protein
VRVSFQVTGDPRFLFQSEDPVSCEVPFAVSSGKFRVIILHLAMIFYNICICKRYTLLIDTILATGQCQWPRGLRCGSAAFGVLRFLVQILPGACVSLFASFVSC